MSTRRRRVTGRSESGRVLALPAVLLESAEYARLSAWGVKFLIDLASQYKGNNNGDLCAAWSLMKQRGWRSRETLDRAKKHVLDAGFIIITRQGQRGRTGGSRFPTLYAITWRGIDDCDGKLDVPSNPVPLNLWKSDSKARLQGITGTDAVLKQVVNG